MGINNYPIPSSGSSTSTVLPVNASSVILDGSLTSATTYTTTVNGNGGPAYLFASGNSATITVGGTAYTALVNSAVTSKAFGASTSVTIAANYNAPLSFTASTLSSSATWSAVAYGSGKFVAVANGSTTAGAYSTIGTTWTASTMPGARNWQNVTYGNGYFIAVAWTTTASAYSTNGTTWTASTMPSSAYWDGVTYGNGYYVAVSQTTAGAYSTNGTTWTASTLPSSLNWDGITYGNGKFVAVQGGGSSAVGAYFAQTQTLPVNFGIYAGPTTIN